VAKVLKERDIKRALIERVEALGGELRKVEWVGRRNAPDWIVMLAPGSVLHSNLICRDGLSVWVELKNPETIKTFPADAHERAQHREHERMRALGQRVEVIGTLEQIERLLS